MAEERQSDFACLPDNSPFKRVLLKKCLKRIEKFNRLGIEQVLIKLCPSLVADIYLYFSYYYSIILLSISFHNTNGLLVLTSCS